MVDVILVDKKDNQIGLCEKYEAHEKWLLHRAFSVYIFDHKWRTLLQQRAFSKYHSPGLYANTCCSHQYEWEDSLVAAHRRMIEEMGFDCELEKVTELIYQTPVPPWLTEHEYLHVFFGRYSWEEVKPVAEEVASFRRVNLYELKEMSVSNDSTLAPWTREVFLRLEERFRSYVW